MVTKPAEGMAAAPIAANVAVQATTTVPAKPKDTPCACRVAYVQQWERLNLTCSIATLTYNHALHKLILSLEAGAMDGLQRSYSVT